jgi:indolepyruvate ferredoxin oxidoreductase beta subunit
MNFDLVVCGVGGQGVLSIAWVIGQAAVEAGFHLKQPEVHGMAQRGGAVSALVRIADAPIASDLIADGTANLALAVEPMESLRYTRMLRPDAWIVTDVTPVRNVAVYPDTAKLFDVLFSAPRVIAIDAARFARQAGVAKAHNVAMLGAASALMPVSTALIEKHLRALFAGKGERVVAANVDAFRRGDAAGRFAAALIAGGAPASTVARVVPRLDFEPEPVPETLVDAWRDALREPGAEAAAARMFASDAVHALDAGLAELAAGVRA